jgi:cyclohexadieny/prephenate dehydrogenase
MSGADRRPFAPVRPEPLVGKLAIIGFGLIGSSIARAARELNLAGIIAAGDSSATVCARVRELALADEAGTDLAAVVRDADLVILCAPVGVCGPIAETIAPALKAGAILSDVGSVKGAIVEKVGPHVPAGVHFIPAHPVAGTEHSGPDAGFASLFLNRWCILTPLEAVDEAALATLRAFWEGMGAIVETMTAQHHDLVLAVTSHLPHLIAYNIVGTAADLETVTESEVIKFSAGGFRDFTRIAASDPTMWRDVFLNNREAVLEMLGRFNEDLAALAKAIRWGDGEALHDHFTRTRAIRRGIVAMGQEKPETEKLKG